MGDGAGHPATADGLASAGTRARCAKSAGPLAVRKITGPT
jgi:hypothetical protein